ncbi:MAG: DNA repair protein RecN [Verrucomicrobia bacterium]|nr:DNA repair protein RecN [Verrucomicrobiota bacterium]
MPATLRSLRIRNLALVESLDWSLKPGFNVVTGETGAGKSIILGALTLVLGERADKTLIRTGADQCSVEAAFELSDAGKLNAFLEEHGIEPCEAGQLLTKRVFTGSGINRQFINGSQTTLATLKEVGAGLVDLHGPHDHQSLFSREQQLAITDAYAGAAEVLNRYGSAFAALSRLRDELETLQSEHSEQNLSLWRHQHQELTNGDLRTGELDELQARYSVAANARRILELTAAVSEGLSQADDSILNRLGEVARSLRELERLDPATRPFVSQHEGVAVEVEELERSVSDYRKRVEIDPEALHEMETRLNLLQSLQRKYHRNEAELIGLREELGGRIARYDQRDEIRQALERKLAAQREEALEWAARLSKARAAAAARLAPVVQQHLTELGFKQSHFEVRLTKSPDLTPHGSDEVDFLFAPNPGEASKPLRAIASSGEISRVMLALKTALAAEDLIGLLVFDEIDANVGGEVANAVGAKMRAIADSRQLLAITHMPQVASAADTHFCVAKDIAEGRTRTTLRAVTGEERVQEIARMLGGKSKLALEHARELLKTKRTSPRLRE